MPPTLSLLGGPLHRLGRRLGLVRGGTNTVPLGLALGVFLWSVFGALKLIEDAGGQVFALGAIGGHVRLLIAIPLFFLGEAFWDPRAGELAREVARAGIVPARAVPALDAEIERTNRWKDSWLGDTLCLLAAVLLSWLAAPWLQQQGATAAFDPHRAAAGMRLAGWWYWLVCLPLFRFLILRWLWRLYLWAHFLWKLSKLELELVPTHPDRAGGLGFLEIVHMAFMPLVAAISAVQAASLAEEISAGATAFAAVYPAFALILALDAVLFLGPLFIFAPKLLASRVQGLSTYMGFASRYVSEFDRKWLGAKGSDEPLLGTPDLQSLADLSNSVSIVRDMRWVPVSGRLLMAIGGAALLPMLPLLLLKYPVAELAQMFLRRMAGL